MKWNLLGVMLGMVADDLFQCQRRPVASDNVVDKANIVRRPVPVEFVDFVVADMGQAIDLMADTVIVLSRYSTANRNMKIKYILNSSFKKCMASKKIHRISSVSSIRRQRIY